MIGIKMIKTRKGKEIIEDYKKTYGSIDNLREIIKIKPKNPKMAFDLEEWEHYLKHPNEEVKDGKTIFRDHTSFSILELELMSFIKHQKPQSISELAKLIHKDITTVHKKIKKLEEEGLIEIKKGSKNKKFPRLNYDKIEIVI